MKRSGLGRGLDALLSNTQIGADAPSTATDRPPQSAARSSTQAVPIDAIVPNPFQPRQVMEPAALEELTASVRVHGLIQPLVVTQDGTRFTLIAGERRWRAAQLAGLSHVPVVVRSATQQEMLALAIIENVQRSNLDAMEAARAYRRLMDEFQLTQVEVADLVGKSRPAIANTVRLLGLPPELQDWVAQGHLTEGHGRALLGLPKLEDQMAAARRAVAAGWTVRQLEEDVRVLSQRAKAQLAAPRGTDADRADSASGAGSGAGSVDPNTASAIRDLEGALGTRVELRRRGQGGQLVIHFYSEEELNGLYDFLTRGT